MTTRRSFLQFLGLGVIVALGLPIKSHRVSKPKITFESASQLRKFHGFDAEKELIDKLTEEIQLELDREIIRKLIV